MAVTFSDTASGSTSHQLNLGLRWLSADPERPGRQDEPVSTFAEFLARAESLPDQPRLKWVRVWPLIAAVNGILVFSGLMVWPNQSGVHLLLFLLTFWFAPVALMIWTFVRGVVLGRLPWWSAWLTPHRDRVLATWLARQSLLAQQVFCLTGLGWLWLMLVTRQVIFYWSTSIGAVSRAVDDFLRFLSLGIVATPEPVAVSASQAGAITGWESDLLSFSHYWAGWLTQIMALWVLVPLAVLLLASQVVLRRRLARWYDLNRALRLKFEQHHRQPLRFRALHPEQPTAETLTHDFPVSSGAPTEPGFVWLVDPSEPLPDGCIRLGEHDHQSDLDAVRGRGQAIERWYIPGHAVPTGDLADLVLQHERIGVRPRLGILIDGLDAHQVDTLKLSWSTFLDRNDLSVPTELIHGTARR